MTRKATNKLLQKAKKSKSLSGNLLKTFLLDKKKNKIPAIALFTDTKIANVMKDWILPTSLYLLPLVIFRTDIDTFT